MAKLVIVPKIPSELFLKAVIGHELPSGMTPDEARAIFDKSGLDDLWDYPEDELDEALGNLDENLYLQAVAFDEPGGETIRIFEVTEAMRREILMLAE